MAEQNIIRLNQKHDTEFEFEVTVQGISVDSPEDAAKVRFVIKTSDDYCIRFHCSRREGTSNKWVVVFPPLDFINKDKAYDFTIEVIIDGYYFEPLQSTLMFITDPQVQLTKPISKPKVTATLFGNAEEKKEDDEKEDKKDQEAKSSEDEEHNVVPVGIPLDNRHDVERKNAEKIANYTAQPLKTSDEKPVEIKFGSEQSKTEAESATEIAKRIIFETNIEKPRGEGLLFKKGPDGKKRVKGILDPETKKRQQETAEKIRQLAGTSKKG